MRSASPLKKYTVYLAIVGLGLLAVSVWVSLLNERLLVNPLYPFMLLFMTGTYWLVFAFTQRYAQHKPQTLVKQFHLAKLARNFAFLIIMAVYTFSNSKADAMTFLLNFLVYYIAFSVLETIFLRRWLAMVFREMKDSGGR